jgi:hypothetical protein
VAAPPAAADIFDGLDVSVASGFALGTVSQEQVNGEVQSFPFGGVPFAAILNRDLAEKWSGGVEVELMLDVLNQQMNRSGAAGVLLYHLLGGARHLKRGGGNVELVSTSPQSLSVGMRGGTYNFALASRKNPAQHLTGGVWEASTGLEYRRDLSDTSAIGASAYTTVLTLPSSVERLQANTTEFLGFWRVYL